MKQYMVAFCLLCADGVVFAQVATHKYRIGTVKVSETTERITLHTKNKIDIDIFHGGHTWPIFNLDADGRIYVGPDIIDPRTGKINSDANLVHSSPFTLRLPFDSRLRVINDGYQVDQGSASCSLTRAKLRMSAERAPLEALRFGSVVFKASDNAVLAMVTHFDNAGDIRSYGIVRIDVKRCFVQHATLGRPEMFVELGWSPRGGWWVTGSREQTLLRSTGGTRWRKVPLPPEISSLISSYVVDDYEMWIAANNADHGENDPWLLYSGDGGKNWRSIRKNDPYLSRLPVGWLEGRRRLGLD